LARVPAVSGIVTAFITKAARGGRLLCQSGIHDFPVSLRDFNSLYPFALSKLEIPTTEPIVWNSSMNLFSYRYYILEIDIISCNPNWFCPYLKPGIRVCDKIDIEGIAKYCGVKYRIIRGYVFSGAVVTCKRFIQELAEKKQKASGEERQQLKIALNSIYGKLLMKGHKTQKHKHITDPQHFQKYVAKHWHRVNKFDDKNHEVFINECLDTSFNYATVGVMVLLKSKRIVNELFIECQTKNINVLLSSTDSILIPTDKLDLLRHRTGNQMGMLHLETQSAEAIIVSATKYYLADSHYRSAGTQHKTIEDRNWLVNKP
jgi:hypothetical protein